jgi:hypothetical protein
VSCGHGWHGCGPWYGGGCESWPYERGPYVRGAYGRGWYGPADWDEDYESPRRRRGRGREKASENLEARLSELRDEVRRLEEELSGLRAPGSE